MNPGSTLSTFFLLKLKKPLSISLPQFTCLQSGEKKVPSSCGYGED